VRPTLASRSVAPIKATELGAKKHAIGDSSEGFGETFMARFLIMPEAADLGGRHRMTPLFGIFGANSSSRGWFLDGACDTDHNAW